jgi:hypothetical protein
MDLYKIVGPNGECLNGGAGDWPLPIGDKPGEWRTVDGPLSACRNGLHLATAEQLPTWLPQGRYTQPCVVYAVETDGPLIDAGEKWIAGKVRLLPRSKPMPDFVKLRAKRDRAALKADKARTVKVPDAWRTYLGAVGSSVKLPAGHPGKPYQDALTAADKAYREAIRAADVAYSRAIAQGVMP